MTVEIWLPPQDLALVDTMDAAQNVFLGREELAGTGALTQGLQEAGCGPS